MTVRRSTGPARSRNAATNGTAAGASAAERSSALGPVRRAGLADALGGQLDRRHQATAHNADTDLVFAHPHTGRPIDRSRLLKRYKAGLRTQACVWSLHDLRHTFARRMAAAGIPRRTPQEWLGHRDFKTTLIYADYMPGTRGIDLVDAASLLPTPTLVKPWSV